MTASSEIIQQHLIDPEICIRCNTCEATCPIGAITHDDRNYVVDAEVCNSCMACISPCPTGSIDNWRKVYKVTAYSVSEQLLWDELPAELSDESFSEPPTATSDTTAVEFKVVSTPVSLLRKIFNMGQPSHLGRLLIHMLICMVLNQQKKCLQHQ